MEHVPNASKYLLTKLIDWRRELEGRFVFNPPKAISPQARVTLEKEMDAIRSRLEDQLSSGPIHLHRIKQELIENRRKLQPALSKARKSLAQAEKDLEVVAKRNPLWPIVVVLILAFFFGWGQQIMPVGSERGSYIDLGAGARQSGQGTAQLNSDPTKEKEREAQRSYDHGVSLSRAGQFNDAAASYEQAIKSDPLLVAAYEELGYARYRLAQYEACVTASERAISIKGSFTAYYHLGLGYGAQNNWKEAKSALETAMQYYENPPFWEARYIDLYHRLGRALTELGEAKGRIRALEKIFKREPVATSAWALERVQLADLYCWAGKHKAAMAQYKILAKKSPILAEELKKLISRHGFYSSPFIQEDVEQHQRKFITPPSKPLIERA